MQDFQLEQQQQQQRRRARSLRTPALELLSSESKKKAAAAAGNSNDNFVASLVPEDIHTGLSIHFMKSSEIYARIRAVRCNPTRREEQRVLAEQISTMRKVPLESACLLQHGFSDGFRLRLLICACFRALVPPPAPRMAR